MAQERQLVRLVGAWAGGFDRVEAIHSRGHDLELLPAPEQVGVRAAGRHPGVIVVALAAVSDIPAVWSGSAVRWLAWNRADDPAVAVAAFRAGARMVLPADTDAAGLADAVEALAPARTAVAALAPRARSFARGDAIVVAGDALIEVRSGGVALVVTHPDGVEVLLGIAGPGEWLVAHPPDPCGIRLMAFDACEVLVRSWLDACSDPQLPERLRARARTLEGWAAMLARPHLDQRVLGVLGVLADAFGRPGTDGVVIDLRITHQDLASAVGATRSTVTRLLGELRRRQELDVVGHGAGERFRLPSDRVHRHLDPR